MKKTVTLSLISFIFVFFAKTIPCSFCENTVDRFFDDDCKSVFTDRPYKMRHVFHAHCFDIINEIIETLIEEKKLHHTLAIPKHYAIILETVKKQCNKKHHSMLYYYSGTNGEAMLYSMFIEYGLAKLNEYLSSYRVNKQYAQ